VLIGGALAFLFVVWWATIQYQVLAIAQLKWRTVTFLTALRIFVAGMLLSFKTALTIEFVVLGSVAGVIGWYLAVIFVPPAAERLLDKALNAWDRLKTMVRGYAQLFKAGKAPQDTVLIPCVVHA